MGEEERVKTALFLIIHMQKYMEKCCGTSYKNKVFESTKIITSAAAYQLKLTIMRTQTLPFIGNLKQV